jgi:colanic acid biosynthesis protein WcaH
MRYLLNTTNMFIEKELYMNILNCMPIPTVDILFMNTQGELLLGKRNNEPLMGVYYIPG